MKILIESINHEDQRYETCGDWKFDEDGTLNIWVSKIDDWRYEALIALHEFAEAIMCLKHGITTEIADSFDIKFEEERTRGLHGNKEPGDAKDCPYRRYHQIATLLERALAIMLNVKWREYEEAVNSL